MCMKPINFNTENAKNFLGVSLPRGIYSPTLLKKILSTLKMLNIFARMFHSPRSRLLTVQRYYKKKNCPQQRREKKPCVYIRQLEGNAMRYAPQKYNKCYFV